MSDDKSKAEAFNDFFLSTSELSDTNAQLPDDINLFNSVLSEINVSKQDVLDQLKSLRYFKSFWPR